MYISIVPCPLLAPPSWPHPPGPTPAYHCICWVIYVVDPLADGVGEQALCRAVVGIDVLLSIPHCNEQPKRGAHNEKVLHLHLGYATTFTGQLVETNMLVNTNLANMVGLCKHFNSLSCCFCSRFR